MMSAVDDVDDPPSLAEIGALIEPPLGEPGRAGNRLDELGQWWLRVATPGVPQRVDRFWTPDAPFEPPDSIGTIDGVIRWSLATTDAVIDSGSDVVVLSVPTGPGATPVCALAAHVLGLDAVDAAGWPGDTGASDIGWMVRVTAIRDALRSLRGAFDDGSASGAPVAPAAPVSPDDLLVRLNDRALAAGAAVVLRCAGRRTPMLLVGAGSAVCGLLAWQVNRASLGWWQAVDGPISASINGQHGTPKAGDVPGLRDPLHDRILATLGREPLVRLGLSWADGSAGPIALTMLEMSIARAGR